MQGDLAHEAEALGAVGGVGVAAVVLCEDLLQLRLYALVEDEANLLREPLEVHQFHQLQKRVLVPGVQNDNDQKFDAVGHRLERAEVAHVLAFEVEVQLGDEFVEELQKVVVVEQGLLVGPVRAVAEVLQRAHALVEQSQEAQVVVVLALSGQLEALFLVAAQTGDEVHDIFHDVHGDLAVGAVALLAQELLHGVVGVLAHKLQKMQELQNRVFERTLSVCVIALLQFLYVVPLLQLLGLVPALEFLQVAAEDALHEFKELLHELRRPVLQHLQHRLLGVL